MNTDHLQTIAQATVANGGSTFTREGLVTSGFSVAGIAPAVRVPVAGFDAEVLAAALATFEGHEGAFGTWIEEGEVWIEPTNVLSDPVAAHALALARREIAYFDLDALEEIRL